MKNKLLILMVFAGLALLSHCQPEEITDPDENGRDTLFGLVRFDFPVPSTHVPALGIHRIDLSIALSNYDLYRGDFLVSANTSDHQQIYSFRLMPGEYYFQAGITCTCGGDTCLWDGFPGGRLGTKWATDKFTIVKGETLTRTIKFSN